MIQRGQNVQVIATNTTQNARPMLLHGALSAMPDLVEACDEFTHALAADLHLARAAISTLELTKKLMRSIGQNCIDSENVMNHVAVRQRTAPARIVARHAAERGLSTGGDIDGVPETVRPKLGIEGVERDAGLHLDAGRLRFQIDHIA